MTKVSVSTNPYPILFCDIDFKNIQWSSLLPENISAFKMEEIRRQCSSYSDGLFPGSMAYGNDKQITRIQRFPNYIEYSKILSDELVPISGQFFLTTKFYDRRKEGWESNEVKKKTTNETDVMGYCINGDVYCAADKPNVYKIFYGTVYKSLVEKSEVFDKILSIIKDGIGVILMNADEDFMNNFKNILLSSVKP